MAPPSEPVAIPVGSERVSGTLLPPPRAGAPGVLFVHGWGGSQEQYLGRARDVARLGCACLTIDLRGHARSGGRRETVSRADGLQDLLAAYDFLAGQPGVDAGAVGVVGSSYGGYLAAVLTSVRPVRWLGLRAPALYKDGGWERPKEELNRDPDLGTYRRALVPAGANRALAACAAFRGDVLVVESEHDQVVPHPVVASYLGACTAARSVNHRVLRGADHGLSREEWQRGYTAVLVGWLGEVMLGASGPHPPASAPVGRPGGPGPV